MAAAEPRSLTSGAANRGKRPPPSEPRHAIVPVRHPIVPALSFTMRYLLALLLLLVLAAGGAWVVAGRMAGPSIDISKPDEFVGLSTPLEVSVTSPDGRFRVVRVLFEQNGKQTPLYALGEGEAAQGGPDAQGRVAITKTIDRTSVPDLKTGDARIIVT